MGKGVICCLGIITWFREERQPLWEDPVICKGGTWRLKCTKKDTVRFDAGVYISQNIICFHHSFIHYSNDKKNVLSNKYSLIFT